MRCETKKYLKTTQQLEWFLCKIFEAFNVKWIANVLLIQGNNQYANVIESESLIETKKQYLLYQFQFYCKLDINICNSLNFYRPVRKIFTTAVCLLFGIHKVTATFVSEWGSSIQCLVYGEYQPLLHAIKCSCYNYLRTPPVERRNISVSFKQTNI